LACQPRTFNTVTSKSKLSTKLETCYLCEHPVDGSHNRLHDRPHAEVADDAGVRHIINPPDDADEEAHDARLTARRPGNVWAIYETGTGLPREYVLLLCADPTVQCNGHPARWKTVYLNGGRSAGPGVGGIGAHWHVEGLGICSPSRMRSTTSSVAYTAFNSWNHSANICKSPAAVL